MRLSLSESFWTRKKIIGSNLKFRRLFELVYKSRHEKNFRPWALAYRTKRNLRRQHEKFCRISKSFSREKNSHLCNGTDFKVLSPHSDLRDTIHIGVNFAWRREDIPLDYLFMMDANLQNPQSTFSDVKIEDGFGRIRSKIFVGRFSMIHKNSWQNLPENFYENEKIVCPYLINEQFGQPVHKDICCHGLADLGNVSFTALHFALFTYPKEIYLVGCDTSRTRHFYDDPKKFRRIKACSA